MNRVFRIDQPLSQFHLDRVIQAQLDRRAEVLENQIIWPDPATLTEDDFDQPVEGVLTIKELMRSFMGEAAGSFKKQPKGGGKGGSGGSGGKRQPPSLPNPQTVYQQVQQFFANAKLPLVNNKGNLRSASWNGLFLDSTKVRYFRDAIIEIVQHADTQGLIEVDPGAVTLLAQLTGYRGFASKANTRNQAVGVLINEARLEVLGHCEHDEVANVQGIPDLRPALEVELRDRLDDEKYKKITIHWKSMRGGPRVTSAVRYKQMDVLAKKLPANFKGIIIGDFNFPVNDPSYHDADPLIKAGFRLVYPNDKRATHSMGSRLDACFAKNMDDIKIMDVLPFYTHPNVTRNFSDHADVLFQHVKCHLSDPTNPSPGCTASGGSTTATPRIVVPVSIPVVTVRKSLRTGQSKRSRRKS